MFFFDFAQSASAGKGGGVPNGKFDVTLVGTGILQSTISPSGLEHTQFGIQQQSNPSSQSKPYH